MKRTYFWIILTALAVVISCEKDFDKGEQIYFNSFESNSDTAGWDGYAFMFSNDVPKHGGKQSLSISGGCLIPHAQYTFSPQNTDCNIIIRFWGKNLTNGGGVTLAVNKTGGEDFQFDVSERKWTLYECQNPLFCPANTSLTLEIIAGGILGSAILVDMIEIRKLDINP
jgi:hypothetical protein